MKVSKASREFATRVFRLCLENGSLNEEKLSQSLTFLSNNKPGDYLGVLTALKRLVRLDVDKRTAYIESAEALVAAETARIETALKAKHGENLIFQYATNPELIGGLKVRVGSQIFDGTVQSKIQRLADAI